MSEATTGAPSGDSAASAPGSAGAAADVSGQSGVGGAGNAPGPSTGAATSGTAQDASAAAQQVAEYVFGGRKFRDQKHAEEVIGAQIGRTPHVQSENARLQAQLAEMQQQMTALRAMVGPGGVQGAAQPQKDDGEAAQSLADSLLKSGDLEFLQQLAEDPNIGLRGALYSFAQTLDKRLESQLESLTQKHIQPIIQQRETTQALDKTSGVLRQLVEYFPELDESNQSEEAQQAQQEVLELVKRFPPEMLINDPQFVLGLSALAYREMNGTPVFGQPPGSSGSPSALAAEAAETALQTATPLDGSGVPRPGGAESAQDRLRRAQKASSPMIRSASGRALFRAE